MQKRDQYANCINGSSVCHKIWVHKCEEPATVTHPNQEIQMFDQATSVVQK